ncbi:MAG TPA: cytochrome c oxidase assembly protein [Solirubrobacteraceae bacterium]
MLAVAGVGYLLAAGRVRGGWSRKRSASFIAGLVVVATALLSGIDTYADYLLSVHMVEHMLLMTVAPVLLVCGAPVRLALAASRSRGRRAIAMLLHQRVVALATRPAFGVTLLCAVMLGTYLTGLFELSLRSQTVHALEHAAFFWSGVLCFAPLIAADPFPRPPSALLRFAWLMVVMTAMVVVGALLSFDSSVRYAPYLEPARAMHVSALADQQLAGVVMWFGGGLFGAVLMLVLVTQTLFAEERRQRRRERYASDRAAPGSTAERAFIA